MNNYWWCLLLFRIILPCALIVAARRPTITSYLYLVMGFYLPFFSVPTHWTMMGSTGTYIKWLVIVCILNCSFVTSFFFAIYFPKGKEYHVEVAYFITALTDGAIPIFNLAEEPLMLGTSMLLYLALQKLTNQTELVSTGEDIVSQTIMAAELNRKKLQAMFLNSGKYLVVFMYCVAAVIKPSAFGLIYYFIFLTVLTYWACNKSLGKVYARILICLLPIIIAHLTIIFVYQFQFFQDNVHFRSDSVYGRLFQLISLMTYKDCADPRLFKYHDQEAPTHALPYILFLQYYLTVLISREILEAKDGLISIFIQFFKRERSEEDIAMRWQAAFEKVKQQIEEESVSAIDETFLVDRIKLALEHSIEFIIRISYMVANFIMMIWAITYVGWKTFILLMWANLIWLLPGRRKIMLATSPFLVAYVWFLLTTSYVYSMHIHITTKVGIFHLASGHHFGEELMWLHLLIKSLFSVIIFIPMRQFFQERALRRQQKRLAEAIGASTVQSATDLGEEPPKSKTLQKLQTICRKWLALCWIWIVVITMIWMDFMSTSNPFRITFVGLAVVLVMAFQVSPFNCWKKFLVVYWWIIIIYAMFNLLVVYMYQLSFTRDFLHKYILSKENSERFGFIAESNRRTRLFILGNPLFFQITIVIQQHYLQKDFDKYTSPESPEELAKQEQELEEIDSRVRKIIIVTTTAKNVFFLLLEIHLQKVILLVGWLLCCFDLCALFIPFVFLLTISCICGRKVTCFTIYLMSFFVKILILARLVYMNQYKYHRSWDYVGYYTRNGKTYNVTLNTADWLGFHKSSNRNQADFWQLAWCFLFVFVVTLYPVVRVRQLNYKKSRNLSTARQRVLFPDVNYRNCHDSTKNIFKFLANYGFYKIGIELTLIMAMIVMSIRMDFAAVLIAIGLITTFSLERKWSERVLIPYMLVVGVWLPIQYIINLGYWPTYWEQSRTRFWNEDDFKVRMQQFFHFMNMAHPPPREKIVYDFLLLMCFSRQWRMFRVAKKFRGQEFGGGTNESVAHLIDVQGVENPVPDFVTYSRNFGDIYKKIFFFSWFYISLLMTFWAGILSPTMYSFGYILAAFFLMWEGTEMFLRSPKNVLSRWNKLILYNLCILVFRTFSQIFGCVLVYELQNISCKLFTMFNIGCVDRFDMTKNIPNMRRKAKCQVYLDVLGLKWDCICFFFLIIQQRIFKSFHFFHIVNDAKAQVILANQGAQLIEEQRQKKKIDFDNKDIFIRTNIKKKMQLHREYKEKIQGDVYLKRKQNHMHMLRSGDYYLFDDVEAAMDIPLLPPKQEYVDEEYDPYDPMYFSEYVNLFVKTNLANVLNERALRKKQKQAAIEGKKVEDLKKAVVRKGPKPSSSFTPATSNQSEGNKKQSATVTSTMNVLLFAWGLMESIVVSLTSVFNRFTKDFRYILNEMDKDRRLLKERTDYTQGVRIGSKEMWKPSESYSDFFKTVKGQSVQKGKINYTIYEKLLKSIWYLGVSQSEWLCYLIIVLNQVTRANFISLPLPLMVFCWGSLTVPKPTKTFWVIIIAYALIMSIIKNFFVMDLADWNLNNFPENPFYPPSVIGIDRYINSLVNLALLCSLFFHRVVLQWLGLWEPMVYRTVTLIKDGTYNLKDGKLVPLANNEDAIKNTLVVKNIDVSLGDYFPRSIRHGAGKYAEAFRLFIQQLIVPSSTQIPFDVYTPMLLCDLCNLCLIVFYYKYFENNESNDNGIIEYLQNNRVPVTYIILIVAYSFMIVIDRWIYLRKNRFAKLVYHFFQVMLTHIYAFVLYPMVTQRVLGQECTFVVQLLYVFKCIYFLFSAYQIRSGYPHLISKHFLTHGTGLFNRFGFKLYRMIPYIYELRTLLDWTCTDTSLGVSDWFKMEEINQCIFDQKCQQDYETLLNETGGERKNRTMKYFVGGCLFSILFLTIIFPFLLFSLSGSVGVKTHPNNLRLEVNMGTAEPIYRSYASEQSLISLSETAYRNLTRTFNNIPESEGLFGSFEPEDVVVVKWSSHSLSSWMISPGSLDDLINEVKAHKPFYVSVVIRYSHVGSGGEKSERSFGTSTKIPEDARQTLLDMLGNDKDHVIWLPWIFPKFMMITKEAIPKALPIMGEPSKVEVNESLLVDIVPDDDDDDNVKRGPKRFRNLLLSLQKENGQLWWQIREECADDDNYLYYLKDLVHNSCDSITIYTFNEKVFSETMHYVTGSGILGLYFIYFMVVFGVIRSCMISVSEIWIEDLPNSDRLFRKCNEVYVARDMQDFELEEELVSELIFIMRSREICIKLSRYQDDQYDPTFITPGTKRTKR